MVEEHNRKKAEQNQDELQRVKDLVANHDAGTFKPLRQDRDEDQEFWQFLYPKDKYTFKVNEHYQNGYGNKYLELD